MRTIVITGASSGVGAHAAKQIASAHPEDRIIIVGRNKQRTENVAAEISATPLFADFASLNDVHALAAQIRELTDRIDVLANNAGGLFDGPTITDDGFELTFQVNHLAPMLLTHSLFDLLQASNAKVIATAAKVNTVARLDLGDLNGLRRFHSGVNYANTKLANILFTKELHRRFRVQSVAFHPDNFSQDSQGLFRKFYDPSLISVMGISAEQGGENLAYFIDGTPGIMWLPGQYYSDKRKIGRTHRAARDEGIIRRHFDLSSQMLNLEW